MKRFASLREFCLGVSLTLFGVSACGASDDASAAGGSGGPAGPVTSAEDFTQRLQDAYCSNIGPCCMQWGAAFDPAECRQRVYEHVLSIGMQFVGERFDPDTAQVCIERSLALAKSCIPTAEQVEASDAACRLAAGGYRPGEGDCFNDQSCAPSPLGPTECRVDVCSVVLKLPLGAACTPYDFEPAEIIEECDESRGEVCGPGTGTCVARGLGAECASSDRICEPGLYCGEASCERRSAAGERCAGFYDDCVSNTICDEALGVCRPESEVESFTCNASGCCPADHFRQGGVCVPQVGPGGSCETGVGCVDDGLCACADYRTCSARTRQCFPRYLSLFCAIK